MRVMKNLKQLLWVTVPFLIIFGSGIFSLFLLAEVKKSETLEQPQNFTELPAEIINEEPSLETVESQKIVNLQTVETFQNEAAEMANVIKQNATSCIINCNQKKKTETPTQETIKTVSKKIKPESPTILSAREYTKLEYETTFPEKNPAFLISTSMGISPVLFFGETFLKSYFNSQTLLFTPCLNLQIMFPECKNNFFSLNIKTSTSSFKNQDYTISQEKVYLASQFVNLIIHMSYHKFLPSLKDSFILSGGLGITSFVNTSIYTEAIQLNPVTSMNLSVNFGFAYLHFFSSRFYSEISMDFNCLLSKYNPLIYFQPALMLGFRF